jgi:hypothetical protein
MNECKHPAAILETFDSLGGVFCSCITCEESLHLEEDPFEGEWMAFESVESPKWGIGERTVILVRRSLL